MTLRETLTLRISWLVNEVFQGWSPLDTRLGGSEEGVVEWSRRLAKQHKVTVYGYNLTYRGELDGVTYLPIDEYDGADATINLKCPEITPVGKTWYMTTETDAYKHDLSAFEAVIWPSKWASDNIKVNTKTVLLPYGYDQTKIYPGKKFPQTVLYASSPDRGLDNLLKVWPDVIEQVPGAHLLVTYGAKSVDIPNTMFLGSVAQSEMDDLFKFSDVWAHPANGGELYGITGVKAQAAGCIPVYYPVMALSETVRHGLRSCNDTLTNDLVRALTNDRLRKQIREELAQETYPTWDSTTKQLLDILQT